MPYTLPPITLTQNQMSLVSIPGALGSVSYLKMVNASPYLLQINNLLGGSDYMQPGEANIWPVPGLTTAVQVTPQQFVSPIETPSSVLVVTWYLEGEQPVGNYPVNFNLLTFNGGNVGVATAIVNDGNSVGTNIIESTPAGQTQSFWLARNDGTLQVWTLSNNVVTEVINLSAGSNSTPGSLILKLLETLGVLKLDGGAIVTDGNGNLTVGKSGFNSSGTTETFVLQIDQSRGGGLNVPTAIFQFGGNSGKDLNITLGGDPFAGVYESVQFYTVYNGNASNNFGVGVQGGATNPASWIDQNGVLHATAPVTLAAGNQETGFAGMEGTANAGNNVSLGVNYKTVMTNTPTSVTLTTSFSGNTTVQSATGLTKYGFWLSVKATANGDTYWAGNYTTVGNCLLAVDTTAQTFDHHCDACGAVHMAQSFSMALVEHTPLLALSYLCPNCGARDCLNAAMTAADEADTTPQGAGAYATTRGAQATLIRALMTALGLEVAA